MSVRVEHSNGVATVSAVRLSGMGGYAPGRVADRLAADLTEAEWTSLSDLVDEVHLWDLPTKIFQIGDDGTEWIVEVADHDRYHVVDRWQGGEVESLGRHLLRLAGLPSNLYREQ